VARASRQGSSRSQDPRPPGDTPMPTSPVRLPLRLARRRTNSWRRACPRAAPTVPSSKGWYCRAITGGLSGSTTAPGLRHPGNARTLRAGLCLAHTGAVGDCPQPGSRRGPDPGRAARCWTRRHGPSYQNFHATTRPMLRTGHAALQRSSASRRSWCRSRTTQECGYDRVPLHFDRPDQHAKHYLGSCQDLERR